MNTFRLLQIHLELECITFDHRGDLIHLPCPDSDPLPRVYIGHHPQGFITLFHHDVPPALRDQVNSVPTEIAFREPDRIQHILERMAPSNVIWSDQLWIFQDRISPESFPDVTRLDNTRSELFADTSRIAEQTVFAVVRDNEIVSTCESAREQERGRGMGAHA